MWFLLTEITDLHVSTQNGHTCDFNNWNRGITGLRKWPVIGHSCTRMWREQKSVARLGIKTVTHGAGWPWCDYDGYNWDWCIGK